ncbi:hypothetical protein GOBAR_AA15072 [Gossypium barbadense]|uniref:Uncharacterized protein n=1 Tax=Gossypium barbadense TaxID=3634 RepID=A0A2P5XQL5_GOSBA|nr:hypothetical protein GOBAR_AA15072 [Gossypium barbadense]
MGAAPACTAASTRASRRLRRRLSRVAGARPAPASPVCCTSPWYRDAQQLGAAARRRRYDACLARLLLPALTEDHERNQLDVAGPTEVACQDYMGPVERFVASNPRAGFKYVKTVSINAGQKRTSGQ